MTRRGGLAVVGLFVVTRAILAWAVTHPDVYAPRGAPFVADVDVFARYATNLVHEDEAPYSGFSLEYPPGILPFVVAPEMLRPADVSFRSAFVALMFAVDVGAFVGLLLLAGRWGSSLGPWLWVVLVPLTGPIAYARLDLVPAAATVWALERASARAWFGSGAALGFGAIAKVYPVLLLPAAVAAAPRRRALAGGAAALLLAPLLPLVGSLPEMVREVVEFHAGRGIHLESTFGSLLLFAEKAGFDFPLVAEAATLAFDGSVADALGFASRVGVAAAVVIGAWLATGPRAWPRRAPAAMFGTLAVAVGVGNVFSPQYLLWLIALGSAAACAACSPARRPVLLLVPAAALTQALYPFMYAGLLELDAVALFVLLARNVLVLAAGLSAFATARATSAVVRAS